MSESMNELSKAYCAAFAEMTNAVKNSKNPMFNSGYADLASVLNTVRPVLARHGLSVYQAPGKVTSVGDAPGGALLASIITVLMHTSGQQITVETSMPLTPNKQGQITAQTVGSAISYARRYALAAVCGISQADDDGGAASAPGGVPIDAETLTRDIIAATSLESLQTLRELVVELGDKRVGDAYTTKAKAFKKA